MAKRFVFRDGCLRDKDTNEPVPPPSREPREFVRFQIIGEIREYISPVTGKLITNRKERRYDLESNNCYEIDPPKKPRGYRNPNFALKRGLPLNEEGQQKLRELREAEG